MVCYFPQQGFERRSGGWTPNRKLAKFDIFGQLKLMTVPCGGCIGCRLRQSLDWGIRCMHEASMHRDNCFVTLTYDRHHLPDHNFLDRDVVPDFIRDLRKRISVPIKYFQAGEYGEKFSRPHYHLLIFGWKPDDLKFYKREHGSTLFTSAFLERVWGRGFCPIGEVEFKSACYVARYATKKITGKLAEKHYEYVNPLTGEVLMRPPEYATMSNRGGLGRSWLEKYFDEVYPNDEVLVNGRLVTPPRFYDKILEVRDPVLFAEIKKKRLTRMEENRKSEEQLRDEYRAAVSKFKNLVRSFET